jgi:hypothetical protein
LPEGGLYAIFDATAGRVLRHSPRRSRQKATRRRAEGATLDELARSYNGGHIHHSPRDERPLMIIVLLVIIALLLLVIAS